MKHTSGEHGGANRGTLKSYAAGFLLSIVLTSLAFGAVAGNFFSRAGLLIVVFVCATAQILVQLHYFLHLDKSSAARWNMLALVFTVLIMFLFVGGTLWIMFNLNYRMM